MKNLSYFENEAQKLRKSAIDYRLIPESKLILALMKDYRNKNDIPWTDYKKTYDKWFAKYH